jgi:hypothetical protein
MKVLIVERVKSKMIIMLLVTVFMDKHDESL